MEAKLAHAKNVYTSPEVVLHIESHVICVILLCVYIDEYWINCPRLYFAFVLTLGIIMCDHCSLWALVGLYRATNFSFLSSA